MTKIQIYEYRVYFTELGIIHYGKRWDTISGMDEDDALASNYYKRKYVDFIVKVDNKKQ